MSDVQAAVETIQKAKHCRWWKGHHWGKEKPRYILGHRVYWQYIRKCRWCPRRELRTYVLLGGWRVLDKKRRLPDAPALRKEGE